MRWKNKFFRAINKVLRYIEQSPKKTMMNKISTKSLGLKFKSDNIMKSKAIEFIVKRILLNYK